MENSVTLDLKDVVVKLNENDKVCMPLTEIHIAKDFDCVPLKLFLDNGETKTYLLRKTKQGRLVLI